MINDHVHMHMHMHMHMCMHMCMCMPQPSSVATVRHSKLQGSCYRALSQDKTVVTIRNLVLSKVERWRSPPVGSVISVFVFGLSSDG